MVLQQKTEPTTSPLANGIYLRAALNSETPIFVLIDPILGEPIPSTETGDEGNDLQTAREVMWQRPVIQIKLSQRTQLPPNQHPYLIAINGIDDPLLDVTLDIAHNERLEAQSEGLDGEGAAAHRIGGWLQTTMHFAQLAEHLSLLLQVNTEATTKATYLRLADRRTLALICYVAGNAAIINQFGRLQNWVYLDVQGAISVLKSSGENITPLRLDRDKWSRLQNGEILNRAMSQWLGETHRRELDQLKNRPAQSLYAPLFKAINSAQQAARLWPHRFPMATDQSSWAVFYLLYPAIEKLPAVNELLKSTGTQDDPPEPFRYMHQQIVKILTKT